MIPANAGVGSAIGFLLAPIAYEVVRSRYMRLGAVDADALNQLFADMRDEAAAVVALGAPDGVLEVRRHGYARYVGQGHEIKIELPDGDFDEGLADQLRGAFESEYRSQYHRTVPGLDIEILTWSVTVSSPVEVPPGERHEVDTNAVVESDATRKLHVPGVVEAVQAEVLGRSRLKAGASVDGPVVITESQTTTIVPAGFSASVNTRGDLVLERVAQQQQVAATAAIIRNQVIWDRLITIVEEQAQALIRTAFSTTVREAGDLSAGVFDLTGRMLAQAVTGTPGARQCHGRVGTVLPGQVSGCGHAAG